MTYPHRSGLEPDGSCNLPSGLIFWYTIFMSKTIPGTRKSRGRPATGAESVHLRILPDQSAAIDAWINQQEDADLTRPEAIRRLLEQALAHRPAKKKR
jgi:hypothetical protein